MAAGLTMSGQCNIGESERDFRVPDGALHRSPPEGAHRARQDCAGSGPSTERVLDQTRDSPRGARRGESQPWWWCFFTGLSLILPEPLVQLL